MTTITRPATGQPRRIQLRDLQRGPAASVAAIARSLRSKVADIVAAGQLGPEPEAEIGRWTGARF